MPSRVVAGDIWAVPAIRDYFLTVLGQFEQQGYPIERFIVDPGIGRWVPDRQPEDDLRIIGGLSPLLDLGQPLLVAISRKSFVGATLEIPDPSGREAGSLAATAIAVSGGAHIVRTHDVNRGLRDTVAMAWRTRCATAKFNPQPRP
jgi:dihydropteroate synthase